MAEAAPKTAPTEAAPKTAPTEAAPTEAAPTEAASTEAAAPTETVPEKVKVKSIAKGVLYLSCGALEPEKEGEITYAEFCNLVGTYVEKV